MQKPSLRHLSLMVLPVFCAGCETIYEGKYQFEEGWRPATVVRVVSGQEIPKDPFRDCRKAFSASEVDASRYAVVSYRTYGGRRTAVQPVPVNSGWKPGDMVYLHTGDCRVQLAQRLEKQKTE